MRGELQNFAKAAILAIARQNCSTDERTRAHCLDTRISDGDKRHPRGAARALFDPLTVNICDDCITLFN
ncbi:hypothetical protein DMX02_07155 [Pseudomonas jessenii]|nr:hypothetical protein DMX02_07155 [Pseudomonas jessenii]